MSFDTIAVSPVGTRMLDHLVSNGFAGGRPIADLSEAQLYEVAFDAALDISSEKRSSWPGRSWPWEEWVPAEAVDRLARAVPTCRAARWWSGPVASRPQVWLGRAAAAPTAGILARHIEGKPSAEIWTSSAIEGLPSAWWPYLDRHGGAGEQRSIRQLTPHPDVRVFEIRTPADWRWLCEMFPGPVVDGWVTPGWEAAAEPFDGIHLTVEGLIRAQGVEIETERGRAKLDDWDVESTAWLRWSVVALERLGTVGSPDRQTNRKLSRGRAFPRALRRS